MTNNPNKCIASIELPFNFLINAQYELARIKLLQLFFLYTKFAGNKCRAHIYRESYFYHNIKAETLQTN